MEWYEAAFDRMYPIVYSHRGIDEADKVVEAFEDVLLEREPILDLACGNGRYIESLTRRGFRVYGLDLSHYLLKECADKWGHSDVIVQGEMRQLPFTRGSIGMVINMFTSFGYFSRDTDNLLVLREVFRVLAPGGLFLFDFINAGKINADMLGETVRYQDDFHIEEKRRVDHHGMYLVKDVRLINLRDDKRTEISERLRLYTKDELCSMFRAMGFKVVEVYGDYSRNPFLAGVSERVILLAQKS